MHVFVSHVPFVWGFGSLCPVCTAVMDSYICLVHLLAGIMWEELFNSFATISFTKLILFSILEMRLMLQIWKARRADSFANGWDEIRRQLSILCV